MICMKACNFVVNLQFRNIDPNHFFKNFILLTLFANEFPHWQDFSTENLARNAFAPQVLKYSNQLNLFWLTHWSKPNDYPRIARQSSLLWFIFWLLTTTKFDTDSCSGRLIQSTYYFSVINPEPNSFFVADHHNFIGTRGGRLTCSNGLSD